MQSNEELYLDARDLLKRYEVQKNRYIVAVSEITEADINLDSVRAMVTKELEATATSKAALKEIVAGDKRVLDAKAEMLKKKANKETTNATMDYIDKEYSLRKKRMDGITAEIKKLGG